jgi:hypothetical protein
MKVICIIAVVMLLLLGVAASGSAATEVPIKGTLLGTAEDPDLSAPGCPGAIWRFNGFGTGQMSHLGRVDYEFTHCTYPDFSARAGTFTIVAANGDELVLAYEAQFEVVGAMEGFTGVGIWTAVGGTGRFANATGSGTWDVIGDVPGGDALFELPDGYMQFTFEGMIAYKASDRSHK